MPAKETRTERERSLPSQSSAACSSTLLQAHHVPDVFHELLVVLSGTGWCLVWGGFSWLTYPGLRAARQAPVAEDADPWTRVLSGRFHDPLIGRDLLLGILAGTLMAVASLLVIMVHARSPADSALLPALHSLRSSRVFASRLVFLALDGMHFALGGLFLLVLLRVVLRRTWLAVFALLLLNVPLIAWNWSPTAVAVRLATAALFCVVVLRLGLLAGIAMLATERLLDVAAHHLDFDAWYIAASGLVLLLVLGLALVALRLTLLRGGLELRSPPRIYSKGG